MTDAAPPPEVSVVVATHNRARRLCQLLESLQAQTIDADRFEVIVVDDASSDETQAVLTGALAEERLRLNVFRNGHAKGPGGARNVGWRAARASLIAFIDDDCVASERWLEEGMDLADTHPGSIIQGRVDPVPDELARLTPFTRTQRIHGAGPYFQTCNIFYPRSLLERLGGFDPIFAGHGGEDADLAWRAISDGTPTAFAPKARAFHAVHEIGAIGRLRVAAHWHRSMIVYKRHPELRRAVFTKGIFWKPWHYALFRVLLALLLTDRLWFLRPYLVLPYLKSIELRCRNEGGGIGHAFFFPVEDVVEVAAMVRASVRYRMLVL